MKKLLTLLFIVASIISVAQNSFDRWVPTSGTNTYTTSITSFPGSYNNTTIYLKFGNGNSGNSTIAVNGLSAIPIRLWDGDSWELVLSGEIPAGSNAILSYDNNNAYYKAVIYENIGSGAGGVATVTGTGVDNTDPANPVITITKSTIGLGNVDNTSDVNKPVSTAQQTALDGKVNNTGNENVAGIKTFTSDPIVPAEAYGAGWNGSNEPPTKNDVYDRVEPRVSSTASTASLTPDPSSFDLYDVTALAVPITINNPSVAANGYAFILRLKDNGVAKAITWGADYRGVGGSLPTTTTASETLYLPILYNLAELKWDVSVSSGGTGTTNEIAYFSAPTTISSLTTATYPSLTELSYLKGVTSSIEPRLGGWNVTGTTTLTGAATISSTTPSGLGFTNTSTATANNDNTFSIGGTLTSRNTASDVFNGVLINPTLTRNVGNPATQVANGVLINPTFVNTPTTTNILKLQNAGTDHFTFAPGTATFSRNTNSLNGLTMTNTTSGSSSQTGITFLSSSIGGSLYATSAGISVSGIQEANSLVLQANVGGKLNLGTTNNADVSIWSTNVKRLKVDGSGNFTFTQGNNSANPWGPFMTFQPGTLTALTLNTEFSDYVFANANHTWADGTVTNQRWAWFKSPSLLGTTTLATATNGYTVYIDKPLAGSLGAITNPSALGLAGNLTMVTSRIKETQGTDVASVAGAIALSADGNTFEITGTNAITLISNLNWQNGSQVTLLFTSTATLTDGTANSGTDIGMELAGNVNFVGSADDVVTLVLSEIGGTQRWREVSRSLN